MQELYSKLLKFCRQSTTFMIHNIGNDEQQVYGISCPNRASPRKGLKEAAVEVRVDVVIVPVKGALQSLTLTIGRRSYWVAIAKALGVKTAIQIPHDKAQARIFASVTDTVNTALLNVRASLLASHNVYGNAMIADVKVCIM